MARITRDRILTLEAYAKARAQFRARVMAHKKSRIVPLGESVTLIFEDELTMLYQIQEMLRVERIFEEEEICAEIDAYNPLVPDGANWKATMMIEYPEAAERKAMLEKLIGIEDRVWVQPQGSPRIYAIADEDLERENDVKTSSVHFLRFELDRAAADAAKRGSLSMGIDHPDYSVTVDAVDPAVVASLRRDLTG